MDTEKVLLLPPPLKDEHVFFKFHVFRYAFCAVVVVEKPIWKQKLFVKWHHFHKDLGSLQHLWSKRTTFIYIFRWPWSAYASLASSCCLLFHKKPNGPKLRENYRKLWCHGFAHVRLEIFRCSRSQQKNKNKYPPGNKHIPPLENSKSSSKVPLGGDMLVPRKIVHNRYFLIAFCPLHGIPSPSSRIVVEIFAPRGLGTSRPMRISSPDSNHSLFYKKQAKMRSR